MVVGRSGGICLRRREWRKKAAAAMTMMMPTGMRTQTQGWEEDEEKGELAGGAKEDILVNCRRPQSIPN